jgi:hypothetical protein
MNEDELERESLIALVDLEDNSIRFIDSIYKETCFFAEKIQAYVDAQTEGNLSRKLAGLLAEVTGHKPSAEWMGLLREKLKKTQMYGYMTQSDIEI